MGAPQAEEGRQRKRVLTAHARELARETMHQRAIFNRYLRNLAGSGEPAGQGGVAGQGGGRERRNRRASSSVSLRSQFLQILPSYADRNGFDRKILLDVGVPEADLDAAKILD